MKLLPLQALALVATLHPAESKDSEALPFSGTEELQRGFLNV